MKLQFLLLLLGQLLVAGLIAADPHPPHGHAADVPNFVVDLDDAPAMRWQTIVAAKRDSIARIVDYVVGRIPKKLLPLVEKITTDLDNYVHAPYADELRGVAAATNLNLGEIVIMNMFYELTAGCTSIVAQNSSGVILHARNLDYDLPAMQDLTMTVEFQRAGKTLYKSVTFAGYVGVLTGMRPGAFSVSVDERNNPNTTVFENAIEALFHGGRSLALTLRALTENVDSFDEAVQQLSTIHLIADSYIIMSGVTADQGVVITRDRQKAADVWLLDFPNRWFLVETNYDHWNPPPTHDDRRDPANAAMNASSPATISAAYMTNDVLGRFPVLNSMTVYTAFMCAALGELSAVTQNNN